MNLYEDALVAEDRTLEKDPILLLLCLAASFLWISVFPNTKQVKIIQTSPAKTRWMIKRKVEKLRHGKKKTLTSLQGIGMKPALQCGDSNIKANKSHGD